MSKTSRISCSSWASTGMRVIGTALRVSVWRSWNACVTRQMRVTWKVCSMSTRTLTRQRHTFTNTLGHRNLSKPHLYLSLRLPNTAQIHQINMKSQMSCKIWKKLKRMTTYACTLLLKWANARVFDSKRCRMPTNFVQGKECQQT